MARFRKKIKVSSYFLASVVGGAFLLWGIVLNFVAPAWMLSQARARVPVDFTTGQVKTNFFNSISIKDVAIRGSFDGAVAGVAAHIDQVTISLTPWAYLLPREAVRRPISVKLLRPRVRVQMNLQSTAPSLEAIPLPPIPIKTQWIDGDIRVEGLKEPCHLSHVSSLISVTSKNLKVSIQGSEEKWGSVFSQFAYTTKKKHRWTCSLHLGNADIGSLLSFLDSPAIEGKQLEGKIKVIASAEGPWPPPALNTTGWKAIGWKAGLSGSHLKWRRDPSQPGIDISGDLDLSSSTLVVHKAVIDNAVSIDGTISDPLTTNRKADLSLKADHWPLARISSLFENAPLARHLDGHASAELRVSGLLSNPSCEGSFALLPEVASVKIPPVNGTVQLSDRRLLVHAATAEGTIEVVGSLDQEGIIQRLELDHVSLESIAQANQWAHIRGSLTSTVQRDPSKKTLLAGNFSLREFKWGRDTSTETVTGSFHLDDNRLSVETDAKTLLIRASFEADQTRLETLHLKLKGNALISGSGLIDNANKSLSISIEGRDVPPALWPPLARAYPAIQGSLNFSGQLTGLIKEPDLKIELDASHVQFVQNGTLWSGSTSLSARSNFVRLSDIQLTEATTGFFSWNKTNGQDFFDGAFQFHKANPQLFFELAQSTLQTKGTLSGSLAFHGNTQSLVGMSSVTWSNGQAGPFLFDECSLGATMDKNKIVLDHFTLLKDEKVGKGTGVLEKNGSSWIAQLQIQLQRFGISPLAVDGEFSLKGRVNMADHSASGTVEAQAFWINDYPLDRFEASIQKEGNTVWARGKASPGVAFDIRYDIGQHTTTGNLNASKLDLGKIVGPFLADVGIKEIPQGRCEAKARLTGSLIAPQVRLAVTSPTVFWRNEHISPYFIFEINPTTITLVSGKVELQKGGTVLSSGTITTGKEPHFDLQGAGTSLNLQSVLNLLNWPLTWEGKTDATFSIQGVQNKRKMQLTFQGQHNGFGPFDNGGTMAGTLHLDNGEMDLSGIRVQSGNGFARLLDGSRLFLNRDSSGKIRLSIDTRNLQMGVLTFFGRMEAAGSWKSSPTPVPDDHTDVELDVFARSLYINQFVLDGNITHLTFEKRRLTFSPIIGSGQQLSGALHYENYPEMKVDRLTLMEKNQEKFFLDGWVGKHHWDYLVRAKDIDAGLIRGLFDTTLPILGTMDIRAEGKGSLAQPVIQADVTWRNGSVGQIPLDLATGNVLLENGIVSINHIVAQRKRGYQLYGDMKMSTPLVEGEKAIPPQINLKLTKGNAAILRDLWPECRKAKGSFEAELHVGEKQATPSISGYFSADDIRLQSNTYVPDLSKGELKLRFENNRLMIDRAQAVLGSGLTLLKGYIDFKDLVPSEFDLALITPTDDGASITVPELTIPPGPVLGHFSILKRKLASISAGEPKLDLTLSGPVSSPLLAGHINLENTIFTYPPQKSQPGEPSVDLITTWLRELYRNMRWDLVMSAGNRTWYENDLVNARISGDLHLTGPTHDLIVNGRILTEQGSIIYSGSEFTIKEALLEIVTEQSPLEVNEKSQTFVYLKANAEREVYYTDATGNNNSDVITMTVDRALLGEIRPRFASKNNSNISDKKALQLALGIPVTEAIEDNPLRVDQTPTAAKAAETDRMLRAGLIQLLDSTFASPLARAIARNTGLVDFIRVSYEENDKYANSSAAAAPLDPTAATNNITQNPWVKYMKGTKVQMGRELTSRLFADYSFRVDEFENKLDLRHEVELAYRVHSNLFLRATTELDTTSSLGRPPERRAILENRWRFGLPKGNKQKTTNKGIGAPPP